MAATKSQLSELSFAQLTMQKDTLESSAKVVSQHMQADDDHSELIECLKMDGELPKVSGLNNEDYPGIPELAFDLQSYSQLNIVKKVPLPPELVEQFGYMQTSCQMGLFPEIDRAWLAIDSNIFVWSFQDGSDLAYFDGNNDMIICAGLAKPKEGVFQTFIHYVLCLATPVQIMLLGCSFSRQDDKSPLHEEMHVLPEPLFTFPTDNVLMKSFASTNNGRIFFGSEDGCIYEFTYQAAEGWFSKQCRKINHSSSALGSILPSIFQISFSEADGIAQLVVDNSRNILYGLTSHGTILVYDLGTDGNQMSKVTYFSQQTILNHAASIAETVDKKNFLSVVSICAVDRSESNIINLVAVTQTGVRLYFSTSFSTNPSTRPSGLHLVHVRLPPGFSARAVVDHLSNVHKAIYNKGFVMMSASVVDNQDVLFCATNDLFVSHKFLIETSAAMKLDGHTWAMSEIPVTDPSHHEMTTFSSSYFSSPPLLVTQHMEAPRQFVIISHQGCCILSKPRPVDQLYKLLVTNKGSENNDVRAFFRLFSKSQACAMCLILICSTNIQDKQVIDWAARTFFLYGGQPSIPVQSQQPEPQVWASTPAPQAFPGSILQANYSPIPNPMRSIHSTSQSSLHPFTINLGQTPQMHQQQQQQQPSLTSLLNQSVMQNQSLSVLQNVNLTLASLDVSFSGKHDGLYLFFSRLIRPVWNTKLIFERSLVTPEMSRTFLFSNVSKETLSSLLRQLTSLKNFIQNYLPCFTNSNLYSTSVLGTSPPRETSPKQQDVTTIHPHLQQKVKNEAEIKERASISSLQQLIGYTCESIGLWKVLCDHRFEDVMALLPASEQNILKQVTFKDFVVDGKELSLSLIHALINYYLSDNATTNAVSERLREVCPSIYKPEDAIVSQAREILINARTIANSTEKEEQLVHALKLFKSVCPHLHLKEICNLFNEHRFYHGIVDLVVCMAQKVDPQGLALHYYHSKEPTSDIQGEQAKTMRMECYSIVTDTIGNLISLSLSSPQAQCVPVAPGREPPQRSDRLSPDQAKADSELVFQMSVKTDDELFHAAMYEWLIETNQADALLAVKSHFLETYLQRRINMHPNSQESLDLLWRFYETNGNHSAAARVLSELVDKQGLALNLSQRLEYLARAILSVKCAEQKYVSVPGQAELLNDLEEKMEVARIQQQIMELVQQKNVPGLSEVIQKLNVGLFDITRLYEDFAAPYDLAEIKLAIVHCSGHSDSDLIKSLWQSIIDKELMDTCGNLQSAREAILSEKLISLSQPYIASTQYFPSAFIIEYLEANTSTLDLSLDWIFRTMLSMKFPLLELLQTYHKMYKSKDTFWHPSQKSLHLLQVLHLLIEEFVKDPFLVPENKRRVCITQCLDNIAHYLVDLQSMSLTDPIVINLTREYKSTQHKLERMA